MQNKNKTQKKSAAGLQPRKRFARGYFRNIVVEIDGTMAIIEYYSGQSQSLAPHLGDDTLGLTERRNQGGEVLLDLARFSRRWLLDFSRARYNTSIHQYS